MKKYLGSILGAVLAAVLLPVLAIGLICLYYAEPAVRNIICLGMSVICALGIYILIITARRPRT